MTTFLADTSIWGWAASGRRPDIADKLAGRLERDQIATAHTVALEALHRARGADDHDHLYRTLFAPLRHIPVDDACGVRALEVQRGLAAGTRGNHLRPALDYLLAAAAERAGDEVTLWFFDRDLEVICRWTGQPYEAEVSVGPGR